MLTVMYVPISCDSCKLKPRTRGSEESRVGRKECAGETNCVRGTRPTLDDDHVSNQKIKMLKTRCTGLAGHCRRGSRTRIPPKWFPGGGAISKTLKFWKLAVCLALSDLRVSGSGFIKRRLSLVPPPIHDLTCTPPPATRATFSTR